MRLFCATLFAAAAIFVSAASALTTDRYVANGGSDSNTPCTSSAMPCATIGTAVMASSSGDTIHVAAGTYSERITVNRSLTFLGAEANVDARTRSGAESILDASGNGGTTLFDVTANNVIINGFTIENETNANVFGFAIVLGAGTSGSQILNNIIENNLAGLALAGTDVTIKQNFFRDNNQPGPLSGEAIYSDQFVAGGSVSSILIDSNSFSGNSAAGLFVGDTDPSHPDSQFTISNNSFDSNGQGVLLFDTQSSSITGNTITNSTLASAAIGLDGNDTGLTITGNTLATGDGRGISISNLFGPSDGSGANSDITANQNNITGFAQAGLFVDQTDNPSGGDYQPAYSGTFDATCNWWGSPNGPFNSTVNPYGTGDAVSAPSSGNGMVSFVSWLNAATPSGSCVGTPPTPPQTTDDCKNGGWRQRTTTTGQPFKNQGNCIRYVNIGKKP
jgi:parallel beta-helix repeat protein